MALSEDSKKAYDYNWAYLKTYITDITNVNQTIDQLNSITKTAKGNPINVYTKKNYMAAILNQIRDLPDLKKQYLPFTRLIIADVSKITKHQECSDVMKQKLKGITWSDILLYKNKIIDSKTFSDEYKILIRLYTELNAPVRNDFANITVFIDEPRPIDFKGNCMMLTRKPIVIKPRRKIVVKKSEPIVIYDCDDPTAVIYPVRNVIWLTEFKNSKHDSIRDIVQSIPDDLANFIINFSTEKNRKILFNSSEHSIAKRIRHMFYQVSERKIGINVLRHLYIMHFMKNAPLIDTRKQTANMMGHGVGMQELYRVKLD